MDHLPIYSNRALSVRDLFSSGFESIFIYVEDEEQENLYNVLVRRCIPKSKDFKIFPLRGKENVLSHALSDNKLIKEKRLYLLDKDFDDLHFRVVERDNIVYMDEYSIENALLEENSLLMLAIEERPRRKAADMGAAIDFANTYEVWISALDRLHRGFFLIQKHSLSIRNCDLSPESFCVRRRPSTLDSNIINNYLADVAQKLVDAGVIAELDDYENLSRSAFGSARVYKKHINGKFLLKLWFHRLRALGLIGNINMDSLTIRLCRNSSLKRIPKFKRKIRSFLAA